MNIIFVGILTIGVSLFVTWILEYGISRNIRMEKFVLRYQPMVSVVLMTCILLIPGVLWLISRQQISFQAITIIFATSLFISIAVALLLVLYENHIVSSILKAKSRAIAWQFAGSSSLAMEHVAEATVKSNDK